MEQPKDQINVEFGEREPRQSGGRIALRRNVVETERVSLILGIKLVHRGITYLGVTFICDATIVNNEIVVESFDMPISARVKETINRIYVLHIILSRINVP